MTTVAKKEKEINESGRVSHLPEHGPIAENGKEILLSVRM